MRARPILLAAILLAAGSACRPTPLRLPADAGAPRADAAGARPDGAAGSGGATTPDASSSVDAPVDRHRPDVIPPKEVTAGPCGPPDGPACPVTYAGTSVYATISLAAALAPDGTLLLSGEGVTAVAPDGSPAGAWNFQGGGVLNVAAATGAIVAVGGFGSEVDLDPGPGVDTHVNPNPTWAGSYAVKLTAAGAFVWGRVLTSSIQGIVTWERGIAADDGGVYLAGNYNGLLDLDPGPGTIAPPDARGVFIMRLDAHGDLEWVRTLGGDDCSGARVIALALGTDGAPWFTGEFQGACAFDRGGGAADGRRGIFVASMSPAGQVRSVGAVAGNVGVSALGAAPGGSVYVAIDASTSFPGQDADFDVDPSAGVAKHTLPAGTGACFLLALDTGGALSWSDEHCFDRVAATPDGGLLGVVGGRYAPPEGMLVFELDANRHEAWRLSIGGTSTGPTALLMNARGFIIVGGQYETEDLDPSSGVDRVGGPGFVSRYTF